MFQIILFPLSISLAILIQKKLGKEVGIPQNWQRTALFIGLIDAFFTSLPYALSFLSRFN
jgi:hypothetical protein